MKPALALVTPAYNEQRTLALTIESVCAQSVLPAAWVMVDDGSTDGTGEVIRRCAREHPWIVALRREKTAGASYFGSNVEAIMHGLASWSGRPYDYLGILDADITLPPTYYETIIGRMEQDRRLGIASGVYENLVDGRLEPVLSDRRSTPKAVMVFRHEVFEQIGGLLPIACGGEDTVACIMARMNGWKTWSFPDVKVVHHRPTGTGEAGSVLRARYGAGLAEYGMGSHPLFVLLKCAKRALKEKPRLVGGAARLAGYLYGCMRRPARQVPEPVRRFCRAEQFRRVWQGNRVPEAFQVDVS